MSVLIKGALAGGIAAFIWTNISWMVFTWHQQTISTVPNEAPVAEALQQHIPKDGLYILPWTKDYTEKGIKSHDEKLKNGPYAYMVVRPNGFKRSVTKMMSLGLLSNIIVAFMLTFLLTKTAGLSYKNKVLFVMFAAVTGTFILISGKFIWWQYPAPYLLVMLTDTTVTWGLSGLAIAKFVKS